MKHEKIELLHANALRLGDKGLLIIGGSGAGKSLLTLTLLERAALRQTGGCLVADDYIELSRESGRLVAQAPENIRGAIEIRSAGLFSLAWQQNVRLDLAVELVTDAPRYPENHRFSRFGLSLPCLHLSRLDDEPRPPLLAVCHAIEAILFLPRWQQPL